MFVLKTMEPIPEEQLKQCRRDSKGNINPFLVDTFSMGKQLCKDVFMMTRSLPEEKLYDCYLINTRTGERQELVFK